MEVGILQKKDNGRYWLFMQPSVMGLGSKFKLISIWFNGPQRVIRRVLQRSIYSKHSILTRLFFYQVHKRFCVCTNVLSWILQSLNVKVYFVSSSSLQIAFLHQNWFLYKQYRCCMWPPCLCLLYATMLDNLISSVPMSHCQHGDNITMLGWEQMLWYIHLLCL